MGDTGKTLPYLNRMLLPKFHDWPAKLRR